MTQAFHVEMIKPSHYDDDGYVIQWWKASIPSNSLASLYAIVQDAADRRVLGDDVALTFDGWDECNTIISEDRSHRRIADAGRRDRLPGGRAEQPVSARGGHGPRISRARRRRRHRRLPCQRMPLDA